MATVTFSSRTSSENLAFADAMTRSELGQSFGQYCGSTLIAALREGAALPTPAKGGASTKRASAIAAMKQFAAAPHDSAIGRMSDAEIRDLIAARYA